MKSLSIRDYTPEQIITIVTKLGSNPPRKDSYGNLIFNTICHNHGSDKGSYKLYYYISSHRFHCFTKCQDNFNIYELVAKCLGFTLPVQFKEVANYINATLGLKQTSGFFSHHSTDVSDSDVLDKYLYQDDGSNNVLPVYPKDLITFYCKTYPLEWLAEGVCKESIDKYNIRFDIVNNKIIIPHYDIRNKLVGIKGRALNERDISEGRKYIPVSIEGITYSHPTALNLYGLNVTAEAIRRTKTVIIFEGEKSVLKCDTFFGKDNCSVACCGSTVSNCQRDLLLSLGVERVILALDKEYHQTDTKESDKYADKIIAICSKFVPYVSTYVLWDTSNLLNYKDSPCDRGVEVFNLLLNNKYEVTTEDIANE